MGEKTAEAVVAKKPGNAGGAKGLARQRVMARPYPRTRSPVRLRLWSVKNGAKEGTGTVQRDPSRGEQQLRLPLVNAGGRSGTVVAGQRCWTYETVSRTFRKRAMYENLMDEVVTEENRTLALQAVTRNKGAAGIDRMKTTELEKHLQAHWEKIRAKLLAGTYVPSP